MYEVWGWHVLGRKFLRKINKKTNCSFCKLEFEGVSYNYCSKKCMDAGEIADNIQKIVYCAKILKEKNNHMKDADITKVVTVLDISISKIMKNINSLEKEFGDNLIY